MAALEEVPPVQADRSPAMLLAKPPSARRLAVVDDDDDFRRALILQLESEGFGSSTAPAAARRLSFSRPARAWM